MQFKEIELVEVSCPRCGMIHCTKKENCEESKKYPGRYYARVFCTGNPCDGMNGMIWHMIHGPDCYVTGEVIPETFKHPIKRTFPEFGYKY